MVGPSILALGFLVVPTIGAKLDSQRDVAQMASAANQLLASLSGEQRQRAVFALDSDERLRFHFIPNEMFERNGVMLKEMSAEQRARAHDLLRAGLSARGYLTATQVMGLEDVLLAIEGGGRMARDSDEYFFSVFGTPSDDGPWAWRFEGHHLSLNFTIGDGTVVASSPAFLGANPAEVRDGPQRGLRVLGDREDAARALLESLDASQRQATIVEDVAPQDIITGAELEIDPLSPVGISASALSGRQRDLLMGLIRTYTSVMADDIAGYRLDRLRGGGLENITFAWAGTTDRGERHYYRVQGPTFLIEYDNTQNGANHIHSVWRDFDGDFGQDLLREHIQRTPH